MIPERKNESLGLVMPSRRSEYDSRAGGAAPRPGWIHKQRQVRGRASTRREGFVARSSMQRQRRGSTAGPLLCRGEAVLFLDALRWAYGEVRSA